ncbi:MAG: Ig-like domain-containing protein, partial [Ferruginibacter sp.]
MRVQYIFYSLIIICGIWMIAIFNSGCAQIGAITGGLKDTLAPVLVSSNPKLSSTNISSNKISLSFDEYIDVQELQNNLIVSPLPKINPEINFKLKNLSIKLKDTLLPNTTYSINFGNAIRDVNESNILKDFTYIFSTGKNIDSMSITGNLVLAENDQPDSTMMVMLYKNTNDTAVQKLKPNYIARVNGKGNFTFTQLPPEKFSIYALKDGDGGKTYNSKSELFAFADSVVIPSEKPKSITLFAYAEEKNIKPFSTTTVKTKTPAQKRLRIITKSFSEKIDLRKALVLELNNAIKSYDSSKIILTDSNYVPFTDIAILKDSNKITVKAKWIEDADYRLIIAKNAFIDIFDSSISKSDTFRIKTKKEADYGNVILRFN